jgi:hypothetical protein
LFLRSPGDRVEGFEAGVVEKMKTERNKFRERPGITIAEITECEFPEMFLVDMVNDSRHLREA